MNANVLTILSEDKIAEIVANAVRKTIKESPTNRDTVDKLLTSSEVCRIFKISRAKLAYLQKRGAFPVYKFGGKNFYRKDEIEECILNSRKKYERVFN